MRLGIGHQRRMGSAVERLVMCVLGWEQATWVHGSTCTERVLSVVIRRQVIRLSFPTEEARKATESESLTLSVWFATVLIHQTNECDRTKLHGKSVNETTPSLVRCQRQVDSP